MSLPSMWLLCGCVALTAVGCASTRSVSHSPASARPEDSPRDVEMRNPPEEQRGAATEALPLRRDSGERVVLEARGLVGARSLSGVTRRLPDDCSGFVRYVYERVGVALLADPHADNRRSDNAVTAIHREARRKRALHARTPEPGDLVFFRETYDRNHDGVDDDGLTHIGIVEAVDDQGTVTFIHRASRGVVRAVMNPGRPSDPKDDSGRRINEVLRANAADGAELTGELFVAYAAASAWLDR